LKPVAGKRAHDDTILEFEVSCIQRTE